MNQEEYEERAAILEFEANLSRYEAERIAREQCLKSNKESNFSNGESRR